MGHFRQNAIERTGFVPAGTVHVNLECGVSTATLVQGFPSIVITSGTIDVPGWKWKILVGYVIDRKWVRKGLGNSERK